MDIKDWIREPSGEPEANYVIREFSGERRYLRAPDGSMAYLVRKYEDASHYSTEDGARTALWRSLRTIRNSWMVTEQDIAVRDADLIIVYLRPVIIEADPRAEPRR